MACICHPADRGARETSLIQLLLLRLSPMLTRAGLGTENQEKKQSTSEGGVGGENTLLDGFYDEEEQARQFQAALNAWRTGGTKQEEKKEEKKEEKPEKKVSSICRFMCVARAVCWGVRG